MNTTVKLILDKRKPLKDGTYRIVIRLTKDRRPLTMATGYAVNIDDWDNKAGEIRKRCKLFNSVARVNNLLHQKVSGIRDVIQRLEFDHKLEQMTTRDIITMFKRNNSGIPSVYEYLSDVISEMKSAGKYGNAEKYQWLTNALMDFKLSSNINFADIDFRFLNAFEAYRLSKGNCYNTIAVHLRTLRATFNRAIKEGVVPSEAYPFNKFRIKSEKTVHRALTIEELKMLKKVEVEKHTQLWHAKNFFLASFYLSGISFCDLARLKVSDIADGRIRYKRQKTSVAYSIGIVTELDRILRLYIQEKAPEDYIFPIVKRDRTAELIRRDIRNATKNYNKYLKVVVAMAGIKKNVTGYWARHTWASVANSKKIPVTAISQALGHSSVSTTMVYLDSFDNDSLDRFNEQVVSA